MAKFALGQPSHECDCDPSVRLAVGSAEKALASLVTSKVVFGSGAARDGAVRSRVCFRSVGAEGFSPANIRSIFGLSSLRQNRRTSLLPLTPSLPDAAMCFFSPRTSAPRELGRSTSAVGARAARADHGHGQSSGWAERGHRRSTGRAERGRRWSSSGARPGGRRRGARAA